MSGGHGGGGGKKGGFGKMFARFVLTPLNWFFWLSCDQVAKKKAPFSEWIMSSEKSKKAVGVLGELRAVLCAYFKLPAAPKPHHTCAKCTKDTEFWCVECNMEYCGRCAANAHNEGVRAELHSIEEVRHDDHGDEGVGAHILTPILSEALAFVSLVYVMNMQLIHKDYVSENMCPGVSVVRRSMATMHPNLFYFGKKYFATWCDSEDSFFKLIFDTWVRNIVSDSDNTLLVFQTLAQAILYNVFLTLVLVPLFAYGYALLFNLIYKIECHIPRTPTTEKIEQYVDYFDLFDHPLWGCCGTAHCPPLTKLRKRSAMDSLDRLSYWWNRNVRFVGYFYHTCKAALMHFVWQVTMVAVSVRLGCIWLGWATPIRWLLRIVGFRRKMSTHSKWFSNAAGFDHQEGITHVRVASSWVLTWVPEPVLRTANLCCMSGGMLWIVTVASILSLSWYLAKERREFKKNWAIQKYTALEFKLDHGHLKHSNTWGAGAAHTTDDQKQSSHH